MLPFERLVQAMDNWAAAHPDVPVTIQYGSGVYKPRHAQGFVMTTAAQYRQLVAEAQLFVAHAGMGSIITAIEAGKPLLMLARLQALGTRSLKCPQSASDRMSSMVRRTKFFAGMGLSSPDGQGAPPVLSGMGKQRRI